MYHVTLKNKVFFSEFKLLYPLTFCVELVPINLHMIWGENITNKTKSMSVLFFCVTKNRKIIYRIEYKDDLLYIIEQQNKMIQLIYL